MFVKFVGMLGEVMERLTMTDAEMDEIRSYSPNFDCPVKAEDDECVTQRFCDCVCDEFQSDCPFEKLAKKLKTYEDAEDKGILLRLPCKVGDEAWYVRNCVIDLVHVDSFIIKNELLVKVILCVGYEKFVKILIPYKTLFFTREEAEAALERMKQK